MKLYKVKKNITLFGEATTDDFDDWSKPFVGLSPGDIVILTGGYETDETSEVIRLSDGVFQEIDKSSLKKLGKINIKRLIERVSA